MAKKKAERTSKTKATKEVKDETAILADIAVKGILEKKGKNITCLNLRNISNRVCDYFIICEGDSTTQVDAIARSVEDEVRKATGEKPYHTEGFENSEWVLIDYVTVVVHVFQKEIRDFYNLESLWADAEVQEFAFEC
jgi:ribosome-associated protein